MLIEQFDPPERIIPQPFAEILNPPETLAAPSCALAPPVFAICKVSGSDTLFTGTAGNVSDEGETVRLAGTTPEPVRLIVYGLPGALLVNCSCAAFAPLAVGANTTERLQL